MQFKSVYHLLFPSDGSAEQTARYLLALAGRGPGRSRLAEFGVGTGRIALELARRGGIVEGVDASEPLLERARQRAAQDNLSLGLTCADMRQWTPASPVDVAFCVCATISMLETTEDHQRLFERLAESVSPSGAIVVETHSPARIRTLHRASDTVSFRTPVQGLADGMVSTSRLDDDGHHWSLAHEWRDPGVQRAWEFSHLIEPAHMSRLANRCGFVAETVLSSWAGDAYEPLSPTYICVFRRGRPGS